MISLLEWHSHLVEKDCLRPEQERLVSSYAARVADALEQGGVEAVEDLLRELLVAHESVEGEPVSHVDDDPGVGEF